MGAEKTSNNIIGYSWSTNRFSLSLAPDLLLYSVMKSTGIILSLLIALSSSSALAVAQVGNKCSEIANKPSIKSFFSRNYMARIRPSRSKPAKQILEVFNEADMQFLHNPGSYMPIPVLRKVINNESIKEVHFIENSKDIVLEFTKTIELYSPNKKYGRMQFVSSIPANSTNYIYARNSQLFVATNKSLLIAGKKQSLIQIPFAFAPNLAKVFKESSKINGLMMKLDNDIQIIVDYIPKGKKANDNHIAIFDRETSQFASKSIHAMTRVVRDSFEKINYRNTGKQAARASSGIPKIRDKKEINFVFVALEIPLVLTSSPEHYSVHQTFLSPNKFKTEALVNGYIPIIEKALKAK